LLHSRPEPKLEKLLPTAAGAADPVEPARSFRGSKASPSMTNGQKLKILFADDDETFRLLVKRAINSKSELNQICGIDFVTDGTEAVDYVLGNKQYKDRDQYPLPHVLLLDQ